MQGQADTQQGFYDTMAVCGHLIPEGSVHRFLASHREELFPPELFSDLYPSGTGRPSVPPEVVATVILLQALEGLSDREATERLARDLAWKAACGLSLTEAPFHPTVLTYFRRRLRASGRPERIFEAVRQVVRETGVLGTRDRRALDSTVLEDAVATQDTVTQITSAIRRVRRLIPALGEVPLSAHDYESPGKPACDWSDPAARDHLVTALVGDALALLGAASDLELSAEGHEAVGLLALVSGQDVEPGDEEGTWRIARRVASDRVISTVDPEARHAHKSQAQRTDGYKAHLAVEPNTGLVTACDLTPANAPDGRAGLELLAEEGPLKVVADSAYGSRGDPGQPDPGRPPPGDQAHPGASRRPRRLHPGRLHHRPRSPHRHLPGRPHRGDHPFEQGRLRVEVPTVSAQGPVHYRHQRTYARHSSSPRRAGPGPPESPGPLLRGGLSPSPPHGRALHRLGGAEESQAALPGGGAQSPVAPPPSGRRQPQAAPGHGASPRDHDLGAGTVRIAGITSRPLIPACEELIDRRGVQPGPPYACYSAVS